MFANNTLTEVESHLCLRLDLSLGIGSARNMNGSHIFDTWQKNKKTHIDNQTNKMNGLTSPQRQVTVAINCP